MCVQSMHTEGFFQRFIFPYVYTFVYMHVHTYAGAHRGQRGQQLWRPVLTGGCKSPATWVLGSKRQSSANVAKC